MMKTNAPLFVVIALAALPLATASDTAAQLSLSPEHERIDFLVGEWLTTREFPDGRTAPTPAPFPADPSEAGPQTESRKGE